MEINAQHVWWTFIEEKKFIIVINGSETPEKPFDVKKITMM